MPIRLFPLLMPVTDETIFPNSLKDFATINAPNDDQSVDCIVSYANTSRHLPISISENDICIASIFITYYVAQQIEQKKLAIFGINHPIQYFIQDYESAALFSWSATFLMAENTYKYCKNDIAIINSQNLSDYFVQKNYQFLAQYHFNPLLQFYKIEPEAYKAKKNLFVVYGRPETPRNCFDIIIEALIKLTERKFRYCSKNGLCFSR